MQSPKWANRRENCLALSHRLWKSPFISGSNASSMAFSKASSERASGVTCPNVPWSEIAWFEIAWFEIAWLEVAWLEAAGLLGMGPVVGLAALVGSALAE